MVDTPAHADTRTDSLRHCYRQTRHRVVLQVPTWNVSLLIVFVVWIGSSPGVGCWDACSCKTLPEGGPGQASEEVAVLAPALTAEGGGDWSCWLHSRSRGGAPSRHRLLHHPTLTHFTWAFVVKQFRKSANVVKSASLSTRLFNILCAQCEVCINPVSYWSMVLAWGKKKKTHVLVSDVS